MQDLQRLRIAIVYDWIDKWGGVERVLLTLAEMFPKADWYTSYYDPQTAPWAKNLNLKTSFIQKLPKFIRKSRLLSFPFYPYAFESFNFSNYNVVITITSSFAKSVITKPSTLHICYLLTPTRYFWVDLEDYLNNPSLKLGYLSLKKLKQWDFVAAQRPDHIISISKIVQQRTKKFYKRDSEVIYPPFDLDYWQKLKDKSSTFHVSSSKFFLVVSRLEPYKRVDLAVNVFNQLNENLIIVGKGSLSNELKRMASKNIQFVSDLTDGELGQLYQNARALIMPQEEEFGYVSLEAQFFGCPVIAYKKGGATETVLENKTGIFFDKQSKTSLQAAVERFKKIQYNLKNSARTFGKENAKRFSKKIFKERFMLYVSRFKLHDL